MADIKTFANDHVFLLEFMVNTVRFEKNDVEGFKVVSLQFLGNPPLVINEKQFLNINTEDLNDSLRGGKSCLFALAEEQMERASYSFDVFVKMQAKKALAQKIEKIGSAVISICKIYNDIVDRTKMSNSNATGKKMLDEFKLYNLRGHEIGVLSIYIRMYCISRAVFTQFKFKLKHKSWYMSNEMSQMSRMCENDGDDNLPENSEQIFLELQNDNVCREISPENAFNLRLFAMKRKNNAQLNSNRDKGKNSKNIWEKYDYWKPDDIMEFLKNNDSVLDRIRTPKRNGVTTLWSNPLPDNSCDSCQTLNSVNTGFRIVKPKHHKFPRSGRMTPTHGGDWRLPRPHPKPTEKKVETKTIVTNRYTLSVSATKKTPKKSSLKPQPKKHPQHPQQPQKHVTFSKDNRLRSGACNNATKGACGCCSSPPKTPKPAPQTTPQAAAATCPRRPTLTELMNAYCPDQCSSSSGSASIGTSFSSYMPCTCNDPAPRCYEPIHVTMCDNEYDVNLHVPCETDMPESGEIQRKPLERNVKGFAYVLNGNGPTLIPQCYQSPNGTVKTHFESNVIQLPYDFRLKRRSEGADAGLNDVDVEFRTPLRPMPTFYSENECQFVEIESADSGAPFGALGTLHGPFGPNGKYTKMGWVPKESNEVAGEPPKKEAGGKKEKGKGKKGGKGKDKKKKKK